MKPGIIAVGLVLAAGGGCVRQVRTAAWPAPPASTPTVWERQVRNAKDTGDGDYQLRSLRDRVAAEPDSIAARLDLARAYTERGYRDVALEICRLAAARFPDSGEAQFGLAGALREMGRRNDAILLLAGFLNTHPGAGAEFHSLLGILHDETGTWAEGEPAHRKALELAPELDYLHNNLGYNLLIQKRYDVAAGEFREALKRNPASQTSRNNLGLALAQQGASSEAVATWQAGADPATAHNNLAAVLIEKGNYVAARKELETALGYNKAFPAALRNLELVSRLDGTPVLFHVKQDRTWWERFKTAFIRLWVGPLSESRTEPVNTASARAAGEHK